MKRAFLLSALAAAIGAAPRAQAPQPAAPAKSKTLDIYVADTEGGKAALFVSPTGQTLLIDSGNPGERDLTRILAMLSDAGVSRLDYLLSTHYHVDHIGGLEELSKRIPIKHYIDHGPNTEVREQVQGFAAAYEQFRGTAQHTVAKPGDRIPVTGLDWRIVSSAGQTLEKPLPGGGQQSADALADGRGRNTSTLTEFEMVDNRPTPSRHGLPEVRSARAEGSSLAHGDVVIAAITSCTNTSNPTVMLGAGLLAKKAVERGLRVPPWVKTSLAPGSRVVSEYLRRTGLQASLDALGFHLVGFGCTTCIGNSGPLERELEDVLIGHDIIGASVLSGNRNFEARIHQSVKANFLMSPPLVVAFAIAGRVDIDLVREPLAVVEGREVYLRDVWPSQREIGALLENAFDPEQYRRVYAELGSQNPLWNEIPSSTGQLYEWDSASLYIRQPPYFDASMTEPPPAEITAARALAIFGDSITTDHISPAGAIKATSPAGDYLRSLGVAPEDLNSYGARRGNHEVMVRGTFANVRIQNLMAPGVEGGVTRHQPEGELMSIYDAAERYRAECVPLLVIAGRDYGAGSSRDWAAKGTRLLGVRAVVAGGFERIHRANLIGMGVLPCQLPEGASAQTLGLDGSERFDLTFSGPPGPRETAALEIEHRDGRRESVPLVLRVDTPIEAEYLSAGGILPYVLERILSTDPPSGA